jgi:hypothetical protein
VITEQVEWKESREGELFFIFAQKRDRIWHFSERSTWEVVWHKLPSNQRLVRQARRISLALGQDSACRTAA